MLLDQASDIRTPLYFPNLSSIPAVWRTWESSRCTHRPSQMWTNSMKSHPISRCLHHQTSKKWDSQDQHGDPQPCYASSQCHRHWDPFVQCKLLLLLSTTLPWHCCPWHVTKAGPPLAMEASIARDPTRLEHDVGPSEKMEGQKSMGSSYEWASYQGRRSGGLCWISRMDLQSCRLQDNRIVLHEASLLHHSRMWHPHSALHFSILPDWYCMSFWAHHGRCCRIWHHFPIISWQVVRFSLPGASGTSLLHAACVVEKKFYCFVMLDWKATVMVLHLTLVLTLPPPSPIPSQHWF